MKKRASGFTVLVGGAMTALLVAACGGGGATATPQQPTNTPAPTPTRAPTATPVPAQSTATPPAATATAPTGTFPAPSATAVPQVPTPAPTTTPTPRPAVPTAAPQGKRGGTLQLRALPGFPLVWDTYSAPSGWVEEHNFGPMMNNLIWLDPYGKDLVGDLADRWEFSGNGRVVTFTLKKGIKFHDDIPFTSKDVAYNLERGWKPRDPRMTYFQSRFSVIEKIEAPDESTVRVTVSKPSNVFFRSLGISPALMFPAHFPFPEKLGDWKQAPVGTGPFKFKGAQAGVRMEFTRNPTYWKPGLPYADGIVITNMDWPSIGIASFRTGKLDATNLDSPAPSEVDAFKKSQGFVAVKTNVSINPLLLNRRPPMTDVRFRQALSLAMDRQALTTVWLENNGSPYAAPLLPPELGGQWGISVESMKTRPGFRDNKADDIARAKQLLAQAGIDPATTKLDVLVGSGYTNATVFAETAEASIRALGFKPNLAILSSAEQTSRGQRGDFDIEVTTMSMVFDDPKDYLEPRVVTGGFANIGKWSNPKVDSLMAEQDATLDVAQRKKLLLDLQEMVLEDLNVIPLVVRFGYHGYQPWLKNFPTNVDFLHNSIFRWEQVWLER